MTRETYMPTNDNPPLAHWRASDRTPQYLADHLLNVAALSLGFSKKIRLEVSGELVGLLHDLGKYSEEFRCYIHSALGLLDPDEDDYVDSVALRGKVDHSSAGAQFVWLTLENKGAAESLIGQCLSLCIASHHSGLIDCLDPEGVDVFGKRMKKPEGKTHLKEVTESADEEILRRARTLLDSPMLLTEIRELLERIKQKEKKPRPLHQQIGLSIRFLFSCLIDADRIDTANFEQKKIAASRPHGNYVPWAVLIDRLEKWLSAPWLDWTPSRKQPDAAIAMADRRRDLCYRLRRQSKSPQRLTLAYRGTGLSTR